MSEKFTCDDCEQEFDTEIQQTYRDKVLCEECYDSHMTACSCCGDLFDQECEERRGMAWGGMCSSCGDEHFECDNCGEIYHNDYYVEDGLCEDCYRRSNSEFVHDYHNGSSAGIIFHPDFNESLYFGVELETDDYEEHEEAAQELHALSDDEKLFWLEHDSSLSNGIEIISQPCTLDYHRETFPWAKINEIVLKHGGKSHDTRTCGLHIHFSRGFFRGRCSELYQLRLIYLFERFWDKLVVFSRRSEEAIRANAKRYSDPNLTDRVAKDKIAQLSYKYWRYQGVNLHANDTIEIRIFRGTLKVETLLASLELVDFLVRTAKKTSVKKLQTMTWVCLMKQLRYKKYSFLPQYLIKKGLLEQEGNDVLDSGKT